MFARYTDDEIDAEAARRFAAMTPAARARLKVAEPDVFELYARAADRLATSGPYEQIAPAKRAELRHTDPARFDRLRADWIDRGSPPCVAGEA